MTKPKRTKKRDTAKLDDNPGTVIEYLKNGEVKKTVENMLAILRNMDLKLRFNELTRRVEIDGEPITDHVRDTLWVDVALKYDNFQPSDKLWHRPILWLANDNPVHPVRDYMNALKWDGVKRIDTWLHDYLGAADTDLIRAQGRLWLVAGVRRVRSPGIKFDTMIVLEGVQGSEKSSALAVLAIKEDWFTDSLPLNATPKVFMEQTLGKFIIEFAELSGLKTRDAEHVKAVLSRQSDRARAAYGHWSEDYKRSCILAGTTNAEKYLVDPTGGRRFWPIATGKIKLSDLKRDVDQIWAEAAAAEAAEESVVLDEKLWALAGEEQSKRREEDPWIDLFIVISDVVAEGVAIKVQNKDVWRFLGIEKGKQSAVDNARLGGAMRANHFESKTAKFAGEKNAKGAWCMKGDGPMIEVWFKGQTFPQEGFWTASTKAHTTAQGTLDGAAGPGTKDDEIPF